MYHAPETISVTASFGPAHSIRPVRFRRGGRLVEVRDVPCQWQTREGASTLHHFAVPDGGSLSELSFDSASLVWKLEGMTDLAAVGSYSRFRGNPDRAKENLC